MKGLLINLFFILALQSRMIMTHWDISSLLIGDHPIALALIASLQRQLVVNELSARQRSYG